MWPEFERLESPPSGAEEFATYSICLCCEKTGQLGVASASATMAVGFIVPFASSGIGAGASQAHANPYLRDWMVEIGKDVENAANVIDIAIRQDNRAPLRQILYVSRDGSSAAYTGGGTTQFAGHKTGHNFAVGGNRLSGEHVLDAMVDIILQTADSKLSLGEKLLRTLEAGHKAGGDERGDRSSSLLITSDQRYPLLNLRVDDHEDPVAELHRLYTDYMIDDLDLDFCFGTKENPSGKIPSHIGEASRWMKRGVRRILSK